MTKFDTAINTGPIIGGVVAVVVVVAVVLIVLFIFRRRLRYLIHQTIVLDSYEYYFSESETQYSNLKIIIRFFSSKFIVLNWNKNINQYGSLKMRNTVLKLQHLQIFTSILLRTVYIKFIISRQIWLVLKSSELIANNFFEAYKSFLIFTFKWNKKIIYHWLIRSNYKNKYASSQHATEMTGVKSPSKPMAEGA